MLFLLSEQDNFVAYNYTHLTYLRENPSSNLFKECPISKLNYTLEPFPKLINVFMHHI